MLAQIGVQWLVTAASRGLQSASIDGLWASAISVVVS
jgi:hypothetical protein